MMAQFLVKNVYHQKLKVIFLLPMRFVQSLGKHENLFFGMIFNKILDSVKDTVKIITK